MMLLEKIVVSCRRKLKYLQNNVLKMMPARPRMTPTIEYIDTLTINFICLPIILISIRFYCFYLLDNVFNIYSKIIIPKSRNGQMCP